MFFRICSYCVAIAVALLAMDDASAKEITFKKSKLDDKFRSEGTAVGDFNHDGKLDISAGDVYFAAPDWRMVPLVERPKTFDPLQYSESFCNFAADLNQDGRTDLIVVDFPGKQTWWLEQPAQEDQVWKRHEAVDVTNNESPGWFDLDGDGKRELLLGHDPGRHIGFAKPSDDPIAPWQFTAISAANAPGTEKFSHGLGAGDVNGDGRVDVLVTDGWWEQPAKVGEGEWKFHKAAFGKLAAQMPVFDFDGDGDADVLTSNPHAFGIWWHEQTPDGWRTHEIDKSFSQTHAIVLADINGDKLPDFVTGKRWWAHGPSGDPGSGEPAVLVWFELVRTNRTAEWHAHRIDDDSGMGTQFEVVDMNADGLIDVVTVNKKGAHYFEQKP